MIADDAVIDRSVAVTITIAEYVTVIVAVDISIMTAITTVVIDVACGLQEVQTQAKRRTSPRVSAGFSRANNARVISGPGLPCSSLRQLLLLCPLLLLPAGL